MGKVIRLVPKGAREESLAYEAKILGMNKIELLEEMISFQEERKCDGSLTLDMIERGIPLFKALKASVETEELKHTTSTYLRHLELERQRYKSG